MDSPTSALARQSQVGTRIALFLLATLVFAFAFAAFLRVQANEDLHVHIEHARKLSSLAHPAWPHFLFHAVLNGAHRLGLTYETATAWVLGICYGGMAVLIAREMQLRGIVLSRLKTITLVICVLVASHIFLLSVTTRNLYFGYFAPTAYHNPTQQLNKLFAVWVYFLYRSHFLANSPARTSSVPLFWVLCVSSALAKPSFLISFVPTAALYAVRDLAVRRWRQALMFGAAIGLPSMLVLAWQARLTYGPGTAAQVAFAPFVIFDPVETLFKLPASLAFPALVALGATSARAWSSTLRFVWILTALSLVAALGFIETGERTTHGNFAWTGQTAAFLLLVESMLFLLTQPRHAWVQAAWVIFGVHVACGVAWYGLIFSPGRPAWL